MTQHGDDAGQGTARPGGRAGSTAVRIATGAACVLVVGAVAAGIGVAANRADLTGASGGAGAGAGATLTPAASPSAPAGPTASVTATPQASAAPTTTATPTPNPTEGSATPEPEPSAPASPPATPIPTPSDVRTDAGPVAEQWLVAAEAEAATEDYSALATQAERDNALVWITQQHIIASCMAEQGHDYTWTAYWQRADDAEAEPSSGVAPDDEALALWGINLTSESQPYRWQDAGCHGLAVHVTGQDDNH